MFDIHRSVFEDGELLEDEAYDFQGALMELYEESPERKAIADANGDELDYWPQPFMDFAHSYLGRDIPQLDRAAVSEIVFDLFPAKVTAPAESAPAIIRELIAFWSFLERAFELPNARECLDLLEEESAVARLQAAMSDPDNFGMAKTIAIQMLEEDVDLSDEQAINQFMRNLNRSLLEAPPLPDVFGPDPGSSVSTLVPKRKADRDKKAKRKTAKASRKRNRKR